MAGSIYLAYFAGITGNSMAMFFIGDGVLSGADIGGMLYDGTYTEAEDGSAKGVVSLVVPAGSQLITGLRAEKEQILTVPVHFPPNFDDGNAISRIETPVGPIHARFQRLRSVP